MWSVQLKTIGNARISRTQACEKLLSCRKKAVYVSTCKRYQMRKNYRAFSVTKPVIFYVYKNTRKCLFTPT